MIERFTDSFFEQAAIAWLEALVYTILFGLELALGEPATERDNYGQLVLEYRLRQALARLNPQAPDAEQIVGRTL